MLNFGHTYLLFKDLKRTYFYGIYVILWDLIDIKKTSFSIFKSQPDCTGGRPDGRPDQASVDRHGRPMCTGRAQRPANSAGRPLGRPTESTPLSGGGGRPCGRSLALAWSTGPHPRVGCFQSIDHAVDQPKWLAFVYVPCTSVDRDGRLTTGPVDHSVDRQQSLAGFLRD